MNEMLFNTIIDKVDAQEKKIADQGNEIRELKEAVNNQPDYKAIFEEVKTALNELKTYVSKIRFPEKEMRDLSANIFQSAILLKQPVENKTLHHHHFPKLLWITVGLLIIFSLICSGWFMTAKDLEQYKAGDTKYRYLKLYDNKHLQQLLNNTDSLYRVDTKMRDSIIIVEEQNQRDFEMLRRAREMENEAKELKEKAKNK